MLNLDFIDRSVTYNTFIRDVASEVVRLLSKARNDPEIISQRKAYAMFGRANVDRWRNEGRVEPFRRPGKVEYRTADLRALQNTVQDYFRSSKGRIK